VVKRQECEADHSSPTSTEVKKTWIYASIPPYVSKVKVKVTLRLTVSQSVCLSVEPKSGTFDQIFFFQSYCLVLFGAPSLTRGRVSHVTVFVIEVYSSQSPFTKIFKFKLKLTGLNTFTIQ
jgi:hypothetical protein